MIRKHFAVALVVGLLGVESISAQQDQRSGVHNSGSAESASDKESLGHRDWPQFRGVQASGVGSGRPPVEWDVASGKNVLWMRKLIGLGHSCPIAHSGRVFLTTAVSETNTEAIPTGLVGGNGESAADSGSWRWQVASFDLGTGVEIWKRTVASGKPAIKRHIKSTHANSTPATDGKHVVACFGSEGLYCLDIDGNLLWQKDFGKLHSGPYDAPTLEWGFASSPIIHNGKVILQCDCLNTGFVAILDVTNGSEILRIKRDDVATWSTPLVITTHTENQLVCNGYRQMAGYDLTTGDQLWNLHGGGDVPVPAPLTAHGLVYLFSGHGRSSAYAVSPAARGNLTPGSTKGNLPDGLAWWQPRGGSYIPTPIVVSDLLYTCSNRGVLTVRKARTGEPVYYERIGGQYSASAVATSDNIYFSSEDGNISVVSTGLNYRLLATNKMQEPVFATPAIVGDHLLIRTTHHIYCIGTHE